MGKWRPSERNAKLGENGPSKSRVGIVGLVCLRCSSGEGRQEPVLAGALGGGRGRAGFVWVSGPGLGVEAG